MSPSPCSFTTALDESFTLTVSLPIPLCLTSTLLPFSRVRNPFLTDTLIPWMCKWTPDGTLENSMEALGPHHAGLNHTRHVMIWVHDESLFMQTIDAPCNGST